MSNESNKPTQMTENTDTENMIDNAFGEAMQSDAAADSPEKLLEELRNQLKESETKALRFQADLDNFRRRTRRETEEQIKYSALPLMSELLDTVDNLNRALDSANSDSGQGSLLEGVRMVANQLTGILTQYGCHPIEAVGQKFDPKLHQAVQMVASDEHPADHIVQEFRPGYQLYDRVIRPAQVVVSTGSSTAN